MYNYTCDASRCLAILSINTSSSDEKIDLRWFGECSPKHHWYSLMFAEHSVTTADCSLRWSVIHRRSFRDTSAMHWWTSAKLWRCIPEASVEMGRGGGGGGGIRSLPNAGTYVGRRWAKIANVFQNVSKLDLETIVNNRDASQILRRGSPMHLEVRLKILANVRSGEYSAISHWSLPNIRRALLPTKHRQWFAKKFQCKHGKFWASGNAPPRVPRIPIIRQRFGYTSRTSPDACQFPSGMHRLC